MNEPHLSGVIFPFLAMVMSPLDRDALLWAGIRAENAADANIGHRPYAINSLGVTVRAKIAQFVEKRQQSGRNQTRQLPFLGRRLKVCPIERCRCIRAAVGGCREFEFLRGRGVAMAEQPVMTGAKAVGHTSVEDIRQRILAAYRLQTAGSARAFERATRVLAGGTTGNLRHFHPYPLYFRGGTGARMVDIDGREYLDCFLCNGPLLLGHRPAVVAQAIAEHSTTGSIVVNPPIAIDLATEVCKMVPCAELVRFLNSGTEAVMTAVRLARAFTGRDKIVKFLGHYHGQDDQFLVGLDPTGAAFGAGIPANAYVASTLCSYGDVAALEQALSRRDVAAVLLDPAMHSGGLWGSSSEYLAAARSLTRKYGALLIFDEVITGFRLGSGGAQKHYEVTPDLATYAKALAAGEKLAAVAGSEEIMRGLDPERPPSVRAVFQSGTGNDGTAALAAALAAVRQYRRLDQDGGYSALFGRSATLAQGLRAAFARHGVPAHVNQLGPMLQLFLTRAPATFEGCASTPAWPVALFYLALINEGVLLSLPTSNHIYLSFAHTDADIGNVLAKVETVLTNFDFGALVDAAAAGT